MEESCHQKSDRQINLEIILTRTSKQPGANKKVTVRGSGSYELLQCPFQQQAQKY